MFHFIFLLYLYFWKTKGQGCQTPCCYCHRNPHLCSFLHFVLLLCVLSFFYAYLACTVDLMIAHPCMRSPCGPYSQCRAIDNHAVCSCLTGYFGKPPNCHPECISNSDCPFDKACLNQICSNPCIGVCGYNARCHVVNHNPICSCNLGFTGDPFVRCIEIRSKPGKVCFQGKSVLCVLYAMVYFCMCVR